MPNLVGYWSPTLPEQQVKAVVERQSRAIEAGCLPYRLYATSDFGWGAALLDHGLLENGPQPGDSADGRWRVLIDGEVHNLDELLIKNRVRGRPVSGQASGCATLLAARGIEAIEEFNGAFVIAAWDRELRQLHLSTDRHGMRPVFYREHEGSVAFATELKGIIAARQTDGERVDPVAFCEQLIYGVHFDGRTWLAGCQRLPPATMLVLSASGVQSRRYWTYRYRYPSRPLDQGTYATQFAVLLDRGVERCMRGTKRIGLFLSGGYDSRSVAAAIRPYHLPIPAFTFGEARSRDMQIAPALAQRLNLQHHALPPVRPYLLPYAAPIVWRTEGLLPFSSTTSLQFHDVMAQHVDIFLTGILAEFSGSHTWPALLMARSRAGTIEAIYRRFVSPRIELARTLLQPTVFRAVFEEVRARFFASFEAIENEHPMDVADAWNFTYLQPGGSFQASSVDRHRFEMRAPHADRDLVDFLLTIPPRARIEQRVYKRMIATAFPKIRDVPCANSMRPIEPRFLIEYSQMALRLIGRNLGAPVRRLVAREDRLGRELNDLDADFRQEPGLHASLLQPLLSEGYLSEEIFSPSAVARIADEHFSGRGDHARALSHVLSLGLAVRLLLRGEVGDVPAGYRELEPSRNVLAAATE